jgi:hypothetical protein
MANHSSSEFAIPHGEDGTATKAVNQLDSAGQAILSLLHKAADAAEANSQQALETIQKLSLILFIIVFSRFVANSHTTFAIPTANCPGLFQRKFLMGNF